MITTNAIAWAQFQLRGGLRSAAMLTGTYTVGIIALIYLTTRLDPRGSGRLGGWSTALMTIQTAILLLFAGSRIGTAIRGDIAARMLESHRLMPLPATGAVLGYIVGGASQALCLAAATFLMGLAVCAAAGLAVDRWILGSAILLVFAAFAWALIALLAFTTTRGKGGMGWVIGLIAINFSSQGLIAMLIPGLTVLISPILGASIYTMRAGAAELTPAYAVSLAGQVVIGAMSFLAAARKYRENDAPGFTPSMALVVLGAWVGLSVYGNLGWNEIKPGFFRVFGGSGTMETKVQIVASLLVAMLMGLLPLAASARAYRHWTIRRELDDPAIGRRPLHPALTAVLVAGLCHLIALAAHSANEQGDSFVLRRLGASDSTAALIVTAAALTAFAFTTGYFLRILHRRRGGGSPVLTAVLVLLLWTIPLLLDVGRHIAADRWSEPVLQRMSTFSPIGTFVHAWGDGTADPAVGVVGQLALAVAMVALFHSTNRRAAVTVPPRP
jgi:hypothetical protein